MDAAGLSRLQSNLDKVREQFDAWANERVAFGEKQRQVYLSEWERLGQQRQVLEEKENAYERAAQRLAEHVEMERQELDAIEASVAQLRARAVVMPERQRELERDIEERKMELERRRAALNECEEARRTRLMHLQKALVWYRDRLGLRFDRVGGSRGPASGTFDGKVRVLFNRLDPRDATREFAFTVYVDERSDAFCVESCQPELDESAYACVGYGQLSDLVDELNRTNDFGAFVAKMRKCFKALTQDEIEAATRSVHETRQ